MLTDSIPRCFIPDPNWRNLLQPIPGQTLFGCTRSKKLPDGVRTAKQRPKNSRADLVKPYRHQKSSRMSKTFPTRSIWHRSDVRTRRRGPKNSRVELVQSNKVWKTPWQRCVLRPKWLIHNGGGLPTRRYWTVAASRQSVAKDGWTRETQTRRSAAEILICHSRSSVQIPKHPRDEDATRRFHYAQDARCPSHPPRRTV